MRGGQEEAEKNRLFVGDSRGEYWLTRVVFLRCLGFIYLVAFGIALNANGALVRGRDMALRACTYLSVLDGHTWIGAVWCNRCLALSLCLSQFMSVSMAVGINRFNYVSYYLCLARCSTCCFTVYLIIDL